MELIDAVKQKQIESGQTDRQFARTLLITRGLWSRIKRGDRPVGLTMLKGLTRHYPELIPHVLIFLRTDDNMYASPVKKLDSKVSTYQIDTESPNFSPEP